MHHADTPTARAVPAESIGSSSPTLCSDPLPLSAPLLSRLDRLAAQICFSSGSGSGPRVCSSVLEDCRQESALLVWQMREKLQSLPHSQRDAYAYASVRNALKKFVSRESGHARRQVSWEHLDIFAEPHADFQEAASAWGAALFSSDLLHQVNCPDLAAALGALSPEDSTLLSLFYALGMSDPEIARQQNRAVDTVRQRRCRALAKLREPFEEGVAPPPRARQKAMPNLPEK